MLTSCPSLTELRLQCLLASCLALTGRELRDISVSAVRNWLLDRKRGGERIRVRAAMNGASVPALGSDPHIFLQASSHVCHMLQMSPIAAQREIVPRDEGRGPKGGEGQRQKVRSRGPWKGRECRKMQGKEGTLGWWWWGCRELTSTPRKREKKVDDARMRTRTRAVGPPPKPGQRDRLASDGVQSGKGEKGFSGGLDRRRPLDGGGGQVPKVPRFARFGFASLEENSVASTLRAAASIAKSPQGRDDFQQEMTGGAHCFPGARQNIAAHVPGVHLLVLGRARRLSMFGLRSGCWLFDERSRH